MSTKSKTKRLLSDVTDEQTSTETEANHPQKKVTPAPKSEQYWGGFQGDLSQASEEQVQDLAKELFIELWKRNGEEAATAITEKLSRKLEDDCDKNERMVGAWKLDKGGRIRIRYDLTYASFKNSSVEVEQLILQTTQSADMLEFKGATDRWEGYDNDFDACMNVKYNPDADTIEGSLRVTPLRSMFHSPLDGEKGGEIKFTATRDDEFDDDDSFNSFDS